MSTYAYDDILYQVQSLTPDEKLQLLADIAVMLSQQVIARPKHSILELEGLGKEIWEGIDAQEYVDQERNAWRG